MCVEFFSRSLQNDTLISLGVVEWVRRNTLRWFGHIVGKKIEGVCEEGVCE